MSEPSQAFSAKQLNWMRRWHSQAHLRTQSGTRPATQDDWETLLESIANQISRDAFPFSGLRWHSVRRKRALSSNLLEDTLVIRKINDNVRRAYGLTQPNRTKLIQTAKQAIRENTPKSIVRIDLRRCFESICRNSLLRQLKTDARLSTQTIVLIESLFEKAAKRLGGKMPEGIPRGLTVSTSLAEIRLLQLDSALRAQAGIYLYLRYVDDILIFSTLPGVDVLAAARRAISATGLQINAQKTQSVRVGCSCEFNCTHGNHCPCKKSCKCSNPSRSFIGLEYLGYKLLFEKHNKNKSESSNEVYCVLSERKAKRIKTRIFQAFRACDADNDWSLLEDRIRYLSSNQRVARAPGRRGLFNGLAYTHAEYEQPKQFTGPGSLNEIDCFYRTSLRRLVRMKRTPPINLAILESLTFQSGFDHKRRTKFPGQRLRQIQSCWEY